MWRYSAYGLKANNVPATMALTPDAPRRRMHHVADAPLSTTMIIQARFTAAAAFDVNRLTSQTIAWSTLLLAGNADSSRVNGAPSIKFDHHHPLSTVLLLCMSATRPSPENVSGTRKSRCQPRRKTRSAIEVRSTWTSKIQ